ncbi:hypothetical protein EV128_116149 [Rhizobium azibense]|nr:hypothetical protein EV128_116149 [Rhizobium azibense]
MQSTLHPIWVAIIGFPFEGINELAALLRSLLPKEVPIVEDEPLRDLVDRPDLQEFGAVSISTRNLATVGKLIDAGIDVRVVVLVEDPRVLLGRKDQRAPGLYRYSFDHCLHLADNGVATLSDPGILHMAALLRSVLGRHPQAITVRYSDLQESAHDVEDALKAFLGGKSHLPAKARDETSALVGQVPTDAERIVRQFRLAPELFDVIKRWGYGAERSWFDQLSAETPHAFEDRPGTIVAYYTRGTRYEQEAARMLTSLSRLGLPVALSAVDDAGDWLANVRRKPHFLVDRRRELIGPLLYVDVDAVIHSDPWPYLRGYTGDCAVAGHHSANYISGTILINDTEGARAFLDAWCSDQSSKPEAWDQHSLHDVVLANQHSETPLFKVDLLPPEMCMVFDRRFSPPITPVIEHLQASRETTAAYRTEEALTLLQRRRVRVAEIDTKLGLGGHGRDLGDDAYRDLKSEERIARTREFARDQESDISRWLNTKNLLSSWSDRAEIAGALVPSPNTVLDLGCGNMDLERHLAAGVLYQPSDIVSRDSRTIVCDLNKGELPDFGASVVSMLGVMEYIFEPKALLSELAAKWPRLLMSYCPADLDAGRDRAAHGWFSSLTSAALVSTAREVGYDLVSIVPSSDRRERIYLFDSRRCRQ